MKTKKRTALYVIAIIVILAMACSKQAAQVVELKTYPVDAMAGILTTSGVTIDTEITSDGRGSLQILADAPRTVRLYETGDVDVENARLLFQARVRTEDIQGQAYLEMWCHFPGKGEYFSRSLHAPLTGTTDWTTQETPFFLKSGQNPDNVKLNVVIDGKGTAWIDDIRVVKGPLK
ncbi:MAG: hypothetical protein OEN01_02370 [Candidatus Krumholzibacteria bacterium]|nr:hypothetical protein [Candidatus Krumholzibacteria bacterium]